MDGTVSAQIFWMKTIAKLSDSAAGDADAAGTVDPGAEEVTLSDRELARRIAYVLDRAARSEGPETI